MTLQDDVRPSHERETKSRLLDRLTWDRNAAHRLRTEREAAEAERRSATAARQEAEAHRPFRFPDAPTNAELKARAPAAAEAGRRAIAEKEARRQFLTRIEGQATAARREAEAAASAMDTEGYVIAHQRRVALDALVAEFSKQEAIRDKAIAQPFVHGAARV